MRNLRDRDRKIEIRGEAQHYATGRLRQAQTKKERKKQNKATMKWTFTPALAASVLDEMIRWRIERQIDESFKVLIEISLSLNIAL